MKKFLFIIVLLAFAAAEQQSYGQVCSPGAIKRWDGSGQPGDLGNGQAGFTGTNLFTINGTMLDWAEHITGPLNPLYNGANPPSYQPDPFASGTVVSPPNVQQDGLSDLIGVDYDRDRPSQDHRDLRFFAFTFDRANSYFFFRRAANSPPQVAYYYLVDINLDGHMRTGEPVIKIIYNGSSASMEMGFFTEHADQVNDGTAAAGNWVINKGNSMVATVARGGTDPAVNPSQWVVGSADGWDVDGQYTAAAVGQLPTLTTVSGVQEVFQVAPINDGPNSGFAVEFSVPWNYLRLYDDAGAAPAPYDASYAPMTYQRVFSWHVSVNNGNSSDLNTAEDNSGGCCSGLAFSGNANTDLTSMTVTSLGLQTFRMKLAYTDVANGTTNVIMPTVKISEIVQFGVIPPDPTTEYTVRVYPADGAGDPIGAGTVYPYSSVAAGVYTYAGGPVIVSTGAPFGTARFVVDVDFGVNLRTKQAKITYTTTNEFAVTSTNCAQTGSTVDNTINIITTALPVTYTSFTATRNHSNVLVKWSTATEINNSGFAVERNINGTWEQVAFVPSQAAGGNSTSLLNYQFNDLNNTKGITQYRIKQIDLDAKIKYSEIRSVRGEAQLGKVIVYPNPTNDGKVNIVFEDANVTRDIAVMDMSGRTVKQMRGITNNNVTIENLTPGMYSVRIVVPATGDQIVEKIVVNKR